MKKKKLCMGAMALALSIGSVVQTSAVYTPVAYASETAVTIEQVRALGEEANPASYNSASPEEKAKYDDAKKEANEVPDNADQADLNRIYNAVTDAKAKLGASKANLISGNQETDKERLTRLTNEKAAVEASDLYKNSTKSEQENYTNAVTAGANNKDDSKAKELADKIEEAKKNLLSTYRASAVNREALNYTVQLAKKLAGENIVLETDKNKIRTELKKADDALKNKESNSANIDQANANLSQVVVDVADSYGINLETYELKQDDIKQSYPNEQTSYANAFDKLFKLHEQAVKYYNDNSKSTRIKYDDAKSFADTINESYGILTNNSATTEQINNMYTKLNDAYYSFASKLDANNTSAEALKIQNLKNDLTTLTGATRNALINTEKYTNANPALKLTYNTAVANANKLLAEGAKPTAKELQNAITSVTVAQAALQPVKTKTLDTQDPNLTTAANNVKTLIDADNAYQNSEAFNNAPTALKDEYKAAINTAKGAYNADPRVVNDLTNARLQVDLAKKSISDFNTNLASLKVLISKDADFRKSAVYESAQDTLKAPYLTAYNKAVEVNNNNNRTYREVKYALEHLKNAKQSILDTEVTLEDLRAAVSAAPDLRNLNVYIQGRLDLKTAYDNAVTSAKTLVDNKSTDLTAIKNAYENLSAARSDLITFNKTLEDLNKLVTDKGSYVQTDVYKLASDDLKKAYDTAIATAEDVNKNKDTKTGAEIIKAVSDVQTAKANLDRAVSERKLQALIDEEKTVKADAKYKDNIDSTKKLAYDNAIANAKTLIKKADRTKEEIEAQIVAVNTAKTNLGITTTLPTNEELENAQKELDALVQNAKTVRGVLTFRTATPAKQKAYNDAINDATALLAKYAKDKTSVTTQEFKDATKKINDALYAIGYKSTVTYSTKLEDLIKEAPEFRKQTKFVEKLTGTTYQKQLVDTYNKLIEEASKYVNTTANPDKAVVDTYVTRINEVKMAIMDEMSETELTLRGLVRESTKYITEKAYTNAKNSKDEVLKMAAADYEKLVLDAREVLGKDSRSDTDMRYYVNRIQNAKAVMTDPSEHNLLIYKLAHLIDQAGKVINATTYKEVGQAKRTKLENAIEKAQKITATSADRDIKEAISDLEAALNEPEFRKILNIKEEQKENSDANTRSLQKLTVKELVELARRVTEHPDFKDVPANQVFVLRQALNALNKAITDNDVDAQAEAKTRVINALLQDKVIKITEKVLNEKADLSLAEKTLELAKKVRDHADFKELSTSNQEVLTDAIDKLEKAIKSGIDKDIDDAQKALQSVLEGVTFKPIVDKINGVATVDEALIAELRALISTADRVVGHADFKKLDENTKDTLDNALKQAKEAVDSKDEAKVKQAIADLKKALDNEKVKAIIDDLGISAREELEKYIKGDEALRKTVAFTKAQKSLRENYIKAIDEAKELLKDSKANKDQFEKARANIEAAVKALDGNEFDAKLKALKKDFAENGSKIPDATKRAEIEAKIKALEAADATMDDLITVETELKNALKLTGNSTPVTTTTTTPGTTVTPVTTPTTTTTPVTTTSTVPATVNPGSIVRTGIKSLIGVVALLAVAVAAYFAVTSKDKKNKANTKRPNEDKKTRTFEGDIDNENN